MTIQTTHSAELPVDRVNQLAHELSAALAEWDGKAVAIVFASSQVQNPVMLTVQREFNEHLRKAYAEAGR